jgi:hypothetical protein
LLHDGNILSVRDGLDIDLIDLDLDVVIVLVVLLLAVPLERRKDLWSRQSRSIVRIPSRNVATRKPWIGT